MKAVLLSALQVTMSCGFRISNVRHLDRTDRGKIALPGTVCSYFMAEMLFSLLGITRVYQEYMDKWLV